MSQGQTLAAATAAASLSSSAVGAPVIAPAPAAAIQNDLGLPADSFTVINEADADAAAAPVGDGSFSPAAAPSPQAPFKRDSRYVLGARPKNISGTGTEAAVASGGDGSFSPAVAPSPAAPFKRDSRYVLGARPKNISATGADAAAAPVGDGSFSPAAVPSPAAPFKRDSRYVLGARPKNISATGADAAATPLGDGSFSPAAAPSPAAPFKRDSRYVLGAKPRDISGTGAEAAAAPLGDGSFSPAAAPSPAAPFKRDSRYVLGARPKNISALASVEADGGAFMRGEKYVLGARPRNASFVVPNVTASAAVEAAGSASFVQTQGTNFVVGGKIRYFSGSNGYFLILRDYLTDAQVVTFFKVMAGNGVDLIRTWGFLNGAQDPYAKGVALQPSIGVFDEISFQRLDLILSEAGKNGVYVILPLVNYWPDLGGMQWYVDQVLGTGHDANNFYTNTAVMQAYKNYVAKVLNRVNSITGIKYSNDPAVFAWELANEPRATQGSETALGLKPGTLVRNWIAIMAAYVRSLDGNHMISTGEEGFLTNGVGYTEDGTAGVNFAADLADPNISFGTIHVYPQNFGIAASNAVAFMSSFISSRAAIAASLGKPMIMEETGMATAGYALYRPDFYAAAFSAAKSADAKAMMPWELVAWHVAPTDSGGFDFGPDDVSYVPVASAIASQHSKARAAWTECANSGTCAAPTPVTGGTCTCGDIAPGSDYTCVEQFSFHGIAMCSYSWMPLGNCDATCGRCTRCTGTGTASPPAALPPPTATAPPANPTVTLVPATSTPAATGAAAAAPCNAVIVVGAEWGQGGSEQGATVQIALTAPGAQGIPTPYTLTYSGGAPFLSASTWDWDSYISPGGQLTGAVKSSYMALLPNGGSTARTGFNVYFSDPAALTPTSITVNGEVCSMHVSSS